MIKQEKNRGNSFTMDGKRLEQQLHKLELEIHYSFRQISWLKKAMSAILVEVPGGGKNHKEYENEGLATVGDTILKTYLADNIYRSGITTKGMITTEKEKYENNDILFRVINDLGWIKYAYNEKFFYEESPLENRVSNPSHSPYIEAIIGAIYYDSNMDTVRRWIGRILMPILAKY